MKSKFTTFFPPPPLAMWHQNTRFHTRRISHDSQNRCAHVVKRTEHLLLSFQRQATEKKHKQNMPANSVCSDRRGWPLVTHAMRPVRRTDRQCGSVNCNGCILKALWREIHILSFRRAERGGLFSLGRTLFSWVSGSLSDEDEGLHRLLDRRLKPWTCPDLISFEIYHSQHKLDKHEGRIDNSALK